MRELSGKAAFAFLVGLAVIAVVFALPGALGRHAPRRAENKAPINGNQVSSAKEETSYPPLPLASFLDPTIGPTNARVTIIAFEDLLCSHCAEGLGTLFTIRARFPKDMRIVWKDFPLSQRAYPFAEAAHHGARCALEQNKFWEYVALFFSQLNINQSTAATVADEVGLNTEAFAACQKSRRHKETIDRVVAQGEALGVNGTPTYFINGQRFDGTPREEELVEIVDSK